MNYRVLSLMGILSMTGCAAQHGENAASATADYSEDATTNDGASVDPQSLQTMIEARGKLAANMENCGKSGDAKAKRKTLEAFLKIGGSKEQFERYYRAGYDPARRSFQSATAQQRQSQCTAVEKFLQLQK